MLDPDIVLSTVITALRDIPLFIAELGDPALVIPHTFTLGEDNSISRSIEQMSNGSVLIAYNDLLGGDFDGMTVWKHRLQVVMRSDNRGVSPPHLWWLMMHKPLASSGLSIRYTKLLGGSLDIPDTPTLTYQQDAQLTDLFVGSLVFPEMGDE